MPGVFTSFPLSFYIDHKPNVSPFVSIPLTGSCSFGVESCLGTATAAQVSRFAYSFKSYTLYLETIFFFDRGFIK